MNKSLTYILYVITVKINRLEQSLLFIFSSVTQFENIVVVQRKINMHKFYQKKKKDKKTSKYLSNNNKYTSK